MNDTFIETADRNRAARGWGRRGGGERAVPTGWPGTDEEVTDVTALPLRTAARRLERPRSLDPAGTAGLVRPGAALRLRPAPLRLGQGMGTRLRSRSGPLERQALGRRRRPE